ncbi:hypothetical protein NWFMUON74_40310 [Nocardia wallacei]|uniref:Uncharacterized protein n=1 Tax=Nocardia wallacei TaxID=480035 RepID=A0A7G1KQU5_9NOCA|nr:hypothetical protein NWFMUON74_40310 [Nocardia wallacei]
MIALLAVTVEGGREILGLWAGDGGEGVCDGLKGLPKRSGRPGPNPSYTVIWTDPVARAGDGPR